MSGEPLSLLSYGRLRAWPHVRLQKSYVHVDVIHCDRSAKNVCRVRPFIVDTSEINQ